MGGKKGEDERALTLFIQPHSTKNLFTFYRIEKGGHDEVEVEKAKKQLYLAEVGIFRKRLLHVWMCL